MKIKNSFFLLVFFLFFFGASAQRLQDGQKQSKYTYIYKLNASQASELYYQRVLKDSLKYFTNLVDSYRFDLSYDQSKLKQGHYLFINAYENIIRYWCYEVPAFYVRTIGINNEIRVFIYDLQGHLLKDASLVIMKKGDSVRFHEDCGCFPIPLTSKENYGANREFLISKGTDFTYGVSSFSIEKPVKTRKLRGRSHSRNNSGFVLTPGYLVLNQPKFKPLDSVIWKALLLKKNGKPMKKEVKVFVVNSTQNIIHYQGLLKPVTKGAYTQRFAIADTFTVDNEYRIEIRSKRKNQLLKSENFTVENYDLKKSFFNVTLDKAYFYAGEAIKIKASAFDVNKLPLLDARVKVVLTLVNVNNFFTDELFVPFSWSTNRWTYETMTDPGGVTEIVIPDSLFPNANTHFNLQTTITNSSGEQQQFNNSFTYDPVSERYTLVQNGDSIRAEFLHNSRSAASTAILKAYNNQLLYEKQIKLPFSFKMEDFPQYYQLVAGNAVVASFDLPDHAVISPFFTGYRTFDSVNFQLVNPMGLEISYKIYSDNARIGGGCNSTLSMQEKLPGGKAVYIIYSYRWKGQEYILEKAFFLREKELKVTIDQPETIYPGQKVVVHVTVRDYKNRNKKNVNLTAYAVNGQFENLKNPDLPDFSPVVPSMIRSFYTGYNPLSINSSCNVNPFYIRLLKLYQSPYYRLIYAENGYGIVYEPIKSDTFEFTPLIIKDNQSLNVYAIYVNNDPVYYSWTNLKNPYSFRYDTGTYNIDIRTQDKMISMKNIKFIKGTKLFLCIREDSLKNLPATSYVNIEKKCLPQEQQLIQKHLLFFRNMGIYGNYYLKQDNKIYHASEYSNYNFYTKKSDLYTAGPFNRGPIKIIIPGKKTVEFYFEPDYFYILYMDSVSVEKFPEKMSNLPTDLFTLFNGIILTERAFCIPDGSVPIAAPQPIPPKPVRTHPGLRNYGNNYQQSGYAYLILQNLTGKDIKNIWLFNTENDKYSRICFYFTTAFHFLKEGRYDLVIQATNDSFLYIRNLLIRPNGTTFKMIKTAGFQPYDSALFRSFEDRIITLNTPPPRFFDNPPKILENALIENRPMKQDTQYLTGFIMDNNNNPINNSTLFLEKNGIFRDGAISNEAGYFEFKNVSPDMYQLKIFINGRFYNIYKVFIPLAKNTVIRIYLPDINGDPYRWNNSVYENKNYFSGTTNESVQYSLAPSMSGLESNEAVTISGVYKISSKMVRTSSKMVRTISTLSIGDDSQTDQPGNLTANQTVSNKFKDFLNKIKSDTNANRIRSNFRDYGYFIPNLITDIKGEASFTVTFPDNQTIWKTFVPAVDFHKNAGLGTTETKAYKPINATLAAPKFLIEHDALKITGKIFNYSGEKTTVNSYFRLDDKILNTYQAEINSLKLDYTWLSINKQADYNLSYAFTTNDGYLDGEKRKLPVYVNGIESIKGFHFEAENDTQIVILSNPELLKRKVIITNNRLDLLEEEIDKLRNYNYGCNEQNASKLKALLIEKSIKKSLGKPFNDEKLVLSLIRKLEKSQRKDGSWGWWNINDETELWMTIYIARAIEMAVKEGYNSRANVRAAGYIRDNFGILDISAKLYAMEFLSYYYNKKDYLNLVLQYDSLNLSLQDRFRLIRLQQLNGLKYNIQTVLSSMVKSSTGTFWGENVLDFKTNIIQTSALAYAVLINDSIARPELLKSVRKYFLSNRNLSRNTIEQATLLQTIVNDIIYEKQTGNELFPSLVLSGKETPKPTYPLVLNYKSDENIDISKKGAPLYFSVYDYKTDTNPSVVDSLYKIVSWFEQSGLKHDTLKKGIEASLCINITSGRPSEYVMIEIPIPSSCYYADRSTGKMVWETHREYYDNKVVIFCRNLPKGKHTLTVSLQPRFEGTSTLLPAKASMMYFPDSLGLGKKKTILVIE